MVQKNTSKTGVTQNWVKNSNDRIKRSEAEKKLKQAKQLEMSKQYERVPHPTLKNTFILKEKE